MIKICLGISENVSVKITAFYANFLRFQRQNYHQIFMTLLSYCSVTLIGHYGRKSKRQKLDRAHFLEFSFSSTEDTFQYNSAQSPFRFQQHLWLSLSLNLSFFSLVAQQYCFILGPDSRSLEGLLEIQTYFPPERNFVKSQTLGVLFR